MSKLIFGIIWTVFIAIFTFIMYGSNGNVTVNGDLVSHEEFSAMLGPKILVGLFWAIGLFMIFIGAKKIIKNRATNKHR